MKMLRMVGIVASLTMAGASVAQAGVPGYATANVNLRTGPDTAYPSAGVIPDGAPLTIEGCLQDESWCDVNWGGLRGWVYSNYLGSRMQGNSMLVPDMGLTALAIPIVAFAASDYWNRYYVGRPWYAQRARWYAYTPRPRAGWYAPPPGPRPVGWWKPGYQNRPPVAGGPRPGGPRPGGPVYNTPGRPGGPNTGGMGRPPQNAGGPRPGGPAYGNQPGGRPQQGRPPQGNGQMGRPGNGGPQQQARPPQGNGQPGRPQQGRPPQMNNPQQGKPQQARPPQARPQGGQQQPRPQGNAGQGNKQGPGNQQGKKPACFGPNCPPPR